MTPEPKTCFADSRRLTGPNALLPPDGGSACGVVLETDGVLACDAQAHARWRANVEAMLAALHWPRRAVVVRPHAGGAMLAFHAPLDLLLLATEVNEWAWERAIGMPNQDYADCTALHAAIPTFDLALASFQSRAATEGNPLLVTLVREGEQRGLPVLIDDEVVSLGAGAGASCWPLAGLPEPGQVPWADLHGIPAALVTGSNGKTTTTRLLTAVAKAAGLTPGYCSTDGVFVDGMALHTGDYSGPAGARTVLRDARVDFAVLETARGGILRRGLALDRAQAAIVTNVSADHFGEYGVDSIADLIDVKLVVAQALMPGGWLVVNADDEQLAAHASEFNVQRAWFSLEHAHPRLQAARAKGELCCGLNGDELLLFDGVVEHWIGAVESLPLAMGGTARYNLANLAGAALLGLAMGFAPDGIRQVFARFGASRHDNPGRLERWAMPGLTVLMDYAHNPDGLAGLLTVARALKPARLGLLLGQAGNRGDDAIRELASAAVPFAPERIVLKDIFLRGRPAGQVPDLLRGQLLQDGFPSERIATILDEVEAALDLVKWARPGDVLVLPVHDPASKLRLHTILDALEARQWRPGEDL